jgi:tripeptide aminopeptidase
VAPVQIDSRGAIDRVVRLMAIPGKSCEEQQILAAICDELRLAGVPADAMTRDTAQRRSPAGGATGNLIVKLPGTVRGPRRLLMAHVDTVPICVGSNPRLQGRRIRSKDAGTGLGGDTRAGVAVVLTAALEVLRQGLPHPPLTLFFPVQEEIGLYGARFVSVNKLGKPALCFNWDGGEPYRICLGATGDYGVDIRIEGIPSHAGVHPEQGVSAIAIASLAITDLVQNGWHGLIVKGKHRGASNVGVIAGGDATNVVTPLLNLKAEIRSHDPVFRKKIVQAYRKAFESAARTIKADDGRTGCVEIQADLKYESFRIEPDEPVVKAAEAAICGTELTPETCISNGGLDANWMNLHGFPTVTLGCGQHAIHTADEWLDVDAFLAACRVGVLLASGE